MIEIELWFRKNEQVRIIRLVSRGLFRKWNRCERTGEKRRPFLRRELRLLDCSRILFRYTIYRLFLSNVSLLRLIFVYFKVHDIPFSLNLFQAALVCLLNKRINGSWVEFSYWNRNSNTRKVLIRARVLCPLLVEFNIYWSFNKILVSLVSTCFLFLQECTFPFISES